MDSHSASHYVLHGFIEKKINVKAQGNLTELFLNMNISTLRIAEELIKEIHAEHPTAKFILEYADELYELSINIRLPKYDEAFLDYIEELQKNHIDKGIVVFTDLSAIDN